MFQDRFKSTIIQNEAYLMLVIAYPLNNPVRARLVKNFEDYQWSSASLHLGQHDNSIINIEFVEEIFGNNASVKSYQIKEK